MRPFRTSIFQVFIAAMLLPLSLAAQEEDTWEYHLSTAVISYHGTFGDTIQFGSQGGVIRVHTNTLEASRLTKLNSGLSHQAVRSFAQDQDGVKWYTTRYKVSALDGENWTIYDTDNSGFPNNFGIRNVFVMPDNKKIFTSLSGILSFDGTEWEVYNADNTVLTDNNILFEAIAPDGTIYFKSDQKLYTFHEGVVTAISEVNDHALFTGTLKVVCAENNIAYITSGAGLGVLSDGSFTLYDSDNSILPANYTPSIVADGQNRLWIQSMGQTMIFQNGGFQGIPNVPGTNIYPLSGNQAYFVNSSGVVEFYDNGTITSLSTPFYSPYSTKIVYVDADGGIWAEAQGVGLFHYNEGVWQMVSIPGAGFPSNYILDMALDSGGNPWFGFITGDVHTLQNGEWERYYNADFGASANETIRSICPWGDKMAYVTQNKLVIVENGVLSVKDCSTDETLCGFIFDKVRADNNGNLWIQGSSSLQEFMVKYDGTDWVTYEIPSDGLLLVLDILPVSEDEFYVATAYDGFFHYEQGVYTQFTSENSPLPADAVIHIFETENGTLWLGTSAGLTQKEGEEWTNYNASDAGIDWEGNGIRDIDMDADGTLWLAWRGVGLVSFDGEAAWQTWTLDNSDIVDDLVFNVAVDPNGYKWIGTEWNAASFLEGDSIVSTVFTNRDKSGLISFPNPTADYFELEGGGAGPAGLELIDINGRVVKSWNGNVSRYDISELKTGVYIARWEGEHGVVSVRVVKR